MVKMHWIERMKYPQPATKDINVQLAFKIKSSGKSEMKLITGLVRKLPKIYSQEKKKLDFF